MVVAAAVGVVVGRGAGVAVADVDLARLMHFTAAVKALLSVGIGAVIWWRVGHPLTAGVGVVYFVAAVSLLVAPGLLWQMAHLPLAAALFHVGLVGFLVAMAVDKAGRGAGEVMLRKRLLRRR
jgi:heme A synthase